MKLQVLKESFHPQAATRVRMWLNEAEEEGLWLLHTVLFIKDREEKAQAVSLKKEVNCASSASYSQILMKICAVSDPLRSE